MRSEAREVHEVQNIEAGAHSGGLTWRLVVTCALLTLVGIALRVVILGVPPVLPLISHDLGLSYTATGLLTGLPILVMAGAAMAAGWLVTRIGARASVAWGLALLAAGAMARGLWPEAVPLFVFTFLLSLGIAAGQTAVPVLTRQWFPLRIGVVSALFTDGLIIGETVSAGVTAPLMRQFFGGDGWAQTLIFWGVPVLVTLALWLGFAPPAPVMRVAARKGEARTYDAASSEEDAGKGKTQGRRVSAPHLGVMLGAGSLVYFGMNAWIPSYNAAVGRAALTPVALVALNAAQLPLSLAVTFVAQAWVGRKSPFIIAGLISVVAVIGWLVAPAPLEPLWAALMGASSALIFTLGFALPPLLARPGEVARLTGMTLTLSYGLAFVGPLLGGALWDRFGLPALAFLPVALAGGVLAVLAALLPPRAAFGALVNGKSS
ncbi:MAG: putative MFS-type transporter [Ktedonobacterales bacterium]|jgi:CP family cyanate transporter-like MFS transporter|nr:MAG: putative MFS-type transporter [Ktedonobacterales bacterium]